MYPIEKLKDLISFSHVKLTDEWGKTFILKDFVMIYLLCVEIVKLV